MFEDSASICYTCFATDDVIVTSHTTLMGISTEYKYWIKSLRENKKHRARRLLKMFPNKNWSLGGLKALIKNDNAGTVRTVRGRPLLNTSNNSICVVNFLISAFSPPRLQFLLGNILSNRFAPYFFIFSQRFDQVLIFSAKSCHWRIDINLRHKDM